MVSRFCFDARIVFARTAESDDNFLSLKMQMEGSDMFNDVGVHCTGDLVVDDNSSSTVSDNIQQVPVSAETDLQQSRSFAEKPLCFRSCFSRQSVNCAHVSGTRN